MSREIRDKYIMPGNHAGSNYFAAISELVRLRDTGLADRPFYQKEIDGIYSLVRDEILTSQARPISPVKFGTSGWRGRSRPVEPLGRWALIPHRKRDQAPGNIFPGKG